MLSPLPQYHIAVACYLSQACCGGSLLPGFSLTVKQSLCTWVSGDGFSQQPCPMTNSAVNLWGFLRREILPFLAWQPGSKTLLFVSIRCRPERILCPSQEQRILTSTLPLQGDYFYFGSFTRNNGALSGSQVWKGCCCFPNSLRLLLFMREGAKEIVFHACLGTVANHLPHTCSTQESSPESSTLCPILFTSTHQRLMVKSFRAECKVLFCLRFPTIGKDGLAFKNS